MNVLTTQVGYGTREPFLHQISDNGHGK